MMHTTPGLGNALGQKMLVTDKPANAAPVDRVGVPSQAQALIDMAKDEAEIADAVNAGALHSSPWDDGLARSSSQEVADCCTLDDPSHLTPSATLPPKS